MKSCFRDVSIYIRSSEVDYSYDYISLPPHHPTKGTERHLLPGGGRRGQYLKVHIHLSHKSAGLSWKPSPITIVNGTEIFLVMQWTSAVTTLCKHFDRNFNSVSFFSHSNSILLQCKRRYFSLSWANFRKEAAKQIEDGLCASHTFRISTCQSWLLYC